jgi:DNA topoisomerase-3
MQKMLSRPPYRLSSSASMDIAEKLYQRGFISYPRTETDKFKEGTDLQHLIQVQTGDREWGAYANSLLMGGFCYPRDGGHDDSAHPPIHPTKPPEGLNQQENQVYDFIARHFLACCSKDGL